MITAAMVEDALRSAGFDSVDVSGVLKRDTYTMQAVEYILLHGTGDEDRAALAVLRKWAEQPIPDEAA